jgi:ABC-type phosphate/phosphonate transport system substrate-binding protein
MLYYRLKVTGQISTPLRIIAPTAPIPEDAVCASPKLSPKARKRIEEALLEFDAKKHVTEAPVSKEASRVTSFAPGEDSTYDVVRKALAAEAEAQKKKTPTRPPARADSDE